MYGSVYGNFTDLLFNLYFVIDCFIASSAVSVASSAYKRKRGGLQLLANQHLSKWKRVYTSLAEGKVPKLKAHRGVYSAKTSPAVSSCNQVPTTCPQGEAQTHPTLTPKLTGEIASNSEKKSPHIIQEGKHTLQDHTNFVTHKRK